MSEVKGLSPKAEVHDTYLDIEPQTGLLVRARKRLQVNYFVGSFTLPVFDGDKAQRFDNVCMNETRADGVNCNGLNKFFLCLSTPSWTLANGGVYMPYAWVEEGMTLSADDAADLKDSLYWIDDFAAEVQQWSFVVAGILFAMLMGMLLQSYLAGEVAATTNQYKATAVDDDVDAVYSKLPITEGYTPPN